MALTWDQIGNLGLTAGQKTKLAQAEAIGIALNADVDEPAPDLSVVTPTQAKAILAFARDVQARLGPAARAAKYIIDKVGDDAEKAAKDAIPSGSL
jgi:hypothetical protein